MLKILHKPFFFPIVSVAKITAYMSWRVVHVCCRKQLIINHQVQIVHTGECE